MKVFHMKIKSILTSILLTATCVFTFASDPDPFDPTVNCPSCHLPHGSMTDCPMCGPNPKL